MIIDANLAELSTTDKDGKNRKKQVLDFDVCLLLCEWSIEPDRQKARLMN